MHQVFIDTKKYHDCTLGRLSLSSSGFQCFTLELPWLNNQINVSCIPSGNYLAKKYNSPLHGEVILLINVDGRSFVEIHSGNFTRQILGCILVGDGIKYLDDDGIPDVTNSRNTLKKLLTLLPEEFDLTIART
jgi:hypothetical protein